MGLFKFETKKNWRRKKFIILSLLVLVCVVGLFSRNVFMQDEIGENATLTITAPYFEDANDLQNALREEKQENPDDQQLSAQYDNVLEMNALLYDLSNAIEKEQWNRVPELESKFLNTVVIHLESGGSFNSFKREELQQKAKKNAILLEHQLPYEDGNYSLTTANFMKIAATILISLLGVLILLFILGDQLSEEFENHTIRTLYTQPLKIVKLLFGKYASMMVGTLFVLFIFIIACLITSLAFGRGFGSLAYPQLVLFDDGFTYITITEYLSKLFTLFIGTASFAFSLVLLFSNLFKNRFSTFLITLLALSLGSLLTNQGEILQTPWNPFYYFRFTELIEYPDTLGNFSYVFILFAYSLIVLYICYMVQKKGFSFHLEALYIGPFGKGKTMKSPNRLFAISLFEWRKIWRQGYLKQMIVVLLLLAVGGYLFISFQTHQTKQDFIQTTKENIKYSEQEIIPWHEEKLNKQQKMVAELESKDFLSDEEEARLEAAPRTISDMQAWLEHAQLQDERSKEMLTAYQEEDWNTYYDYWIYQNQLNKGEIEVRGSEIMTDITSFTYNASITEKELLAKRQFRPVLPSEYVYTIYEEPSHLYEQIKWKKETQRLDSTGLFYLYTFFDWFIYMIPLGLLVFLLGAGFTTEKGKKRTLFLLETQPISKTGIFTGKTVISIMITLGTALGLMVLMILLGTIGNRLGDWMFPVLHYDTPDIVDSLNYAGITNTEGGFHFITMGSYLIETSLLFLATLLFLIVLSLFISLFTESRMNTFVMTGVLAIGGYYLATTSAVSSISPFLPFTYLNIGKIANGEIATVLNNSFIHPWMGIGVLLVSTIILLGIGLVNFQKSGRKNKLSPKN